MSSKPNGPVDALVERYLRLCPEVAAKVSPGLERDEDALQAARIGLWEAAKGWDRRRPFPPYARSCIRHNVIDHLRAQGPDTLPLPEDLPGPGPPEDPPPETPEELKAQVKALFPRRSLERKVLLSLLSGKTKAHIAARLQVSPRTVDRAARRAWDKLRPPEQS